jgi:aryl-alcohol dehydrogenase-like predicted oxidoreductase
MRFAREHGVGVLLGSPQMHGFLATGEEPRAVIERRPRLLNWYGEEDVLVAQEWFEWCREREVGLRHLNMRYAMGCSWADCVLTGARNPAEARTNVHEAVTPLPGDVWREALIRIQELDEQSRAESSA